MKWQHIPVFLPGKYHGQRILVGYSLQGHKELDTTQRLSTVFRESIRIAHGSFVMSVTSMFTSKRMILFLLERNLESQPATLSTFQCHPQLSNILLHLLIQKCQFHTGHELLIFCPYLLDLGVQQDTLSPIQLLDVGLWVLVLLLQLFSVFMTEFGEIQNCSMAITVFPEFLPTLNS